MTARFTAVLALLVCGSGPAWSATTIKTVSIANAGPIWNVCILPPEATLARVGMKGGASLTKESQEWAEKLAGAFQHAVTEAGGKAIGNLSTGDLLRDDDARQSVVRLQRKYDEISVQLRKKPGGVAKGRYTLGDEIALLPCAGHSDSVSFVQAQGVSSTNGRKAFEIVVSPASGLLSPKARFDFWIALVDAKSGQVAAFVHETATDGKIEADPDGTMAHDLAQGLQQVHVGWVRPPAVTR